MEFGVSAASAANQRTACIVVGVHEGRELSPSARQLDGVAGGALTEIIGSGDLEGRLGSTLLLHRLPNLAAERVLLVGLGPSGEFDEDAYREALCAATKALQTTGATEATFCLNELPVKNRDASWKAKQAVLAISEGLYRFDQLKSKPPAARLALQKVDLHVEDASDAAAIKAAVESACAIAEGVTLAKDLGNLPGNICTPAFLAEQAREVGQRHGLKVEILEEKDIAKLGMGAFLAVARGSLQPPKLIIMEYRGGTENAPPVALVGKGITFDTGGISIKPAAAMDEMKFDMCGAASVFGALRAAALMKLPLNIVGIIPAAENMPGGNATKPGDVVKTLSGQTVEILDTDHEGRLVLCDALTYVERYKPSVVIDIATLTDSIVTALGDVATGVFANDDALAREVCDAGDGAWDRAWPMPLWDKYQHLLDSNVADFVNMGPEPGGAITAACFLSRFTRSFPWAHLDIAGTAARSGAEKGATGRPVALLAQFLARRAAGMSA
jgi:leucyl aminopeptidase